MYDDFYEINKQELLKHFKKNSEKNVLNFKLSYIIEKLLYLTPEHDAELLSAIQEFKEKKDNIFKNLRNLEEKINHRNLFFDHNNDSDKMYDVLIAHFKDATTSAASTSSIVDKAAAVVTTMPSIKNGDEKKVERFKRKLKDDDDDDYDDVVTKRERSEDFSDRTKKVGYKTTKIKKGLKEK